MPWSAGVYTRGYPSWTNDANSNLPISATKFDTEDNDFAAGLNNCLTIDGLNKPTASLNWTQQINLTRASDGQLASWARTGGSNNPSLTLSVQDAANTVTMTPSNQLVIAGSLASTFAASQLLSAIVAKSSTPAFESWDTTQGLDLKRWDFLANSSQFLIRAKNDTGTVANPALILSRSGATPTQMQGWGPTAAGNVDMTPDSGSFTATLSGITGSPTVTMKWVRVGSLVMMYNSTVATGISTSTGWGLSGLPAAITPANNKLIPLGNTAFEDNTVTGGFATDGIVQSNGTIAFYKNGNLTGWTASGTKGLSGNQAFIYPLN